MKKILLILLSVSLLLCLCACGNDQTPTEPSDPTKTTDPTKATDATDETIDDGKVTYTVTVTNEQGTPLSGIMVQICKDTCIPAVADANGVASWRVAEDDYKVSFLAMPAGFTYPTDETEFYFAEGETSMTIALKAVEQQDAVHE